MTTGTGWLIEDLPEEPPGRGRRLTAHGGVVILVAVVLTVATAAGLRPRVLAGSGDMRVELALPAPGECLRWDVDVAAPPAVVVAHPKLPLPVVAGSIAPTPCTSLHEGQVVQAWRLVAVDDQQAQRRCIDAAGSMNAWYSSPSSSGWSTIDGSRRASMVRTGTAPTDWVACVLIEVPTELPPAVFSLSAVMTPDTSTGPRWCLDDRERAIGCGQPHRFERIGVAAVPRGTPTCTAFAHTMVGGTAQFGHAGLGIRSGTLTGAHAQVWYCDVVAPSGRRLTASVVGLGSAALPVE